MLFNSASFAVFFALFFCAYWSLRKHVRLQNILVLSGSWFFYGWWDERFLILIGLSTIVDYLSGLGVSGARTTIRTRTKAITVFIGLALVATLPTFASSWIWFVVSCIAAILVLLIASAVDFLSGPVRRKAWLVFSLITNLGLLGAFKYFNFFIDTFVDATSVFGMQVNTPMLHIILPVGISFYTFQTLSYTIDVYRKQMQPTERLIDFAAYVAFFPQLVAGPIERAQKLLPQFQTPRIFSITALQSGFILFLWGLWKKIVIADNLAPIVDAAFSNPAQADSALMLVGIIAFAFQIYGDFSGYSDMARGLARMLGFDLMLNFNLPYFSRTPSEFWRRWHISLSSWLRDYLYIPLGGNRGSSLFTYRNLMLTMLLGGLWHGAAWTFIVWGAFHGFILAAYRAADIDRMVFAQKLSTPKGAAIQGLAWLVMSILTLIGWTFFRANSLGDAFDALSVVGAGIFSGAAFTGLFMLEQASEQAGQLAFYVLPLVIIQILQANRNELELLWTSLTANQNTVRFAGYNLLLFLICSLAFLASQGGQAFLYFDF